MRARGARVEGGEAGPPTGGGAVLNDRGAVLNEGLLNEALLNEALNEVTRESFTMLRRVGSMIREPWRDSGGRLNGVLLSFPPAGGLSFPSPAAAGASVFLVASTGAWEKNKWRMSFKKRLP